MKQELFSLIIWSPYQGSSRFLFTTPNSVDAIALKRQNGPVCETETRKTVFLASVLRLTRVHVPFKSER